MLGKKKEKEMEPEYYLSADGIPTLNYNVYYMKTFEKVLTFLVAFIAGAFVGYLFYGGIGKDEFDQPTTTTYVLNTVIPLTVGTVAGFLFIPVRIKSQIAKRRKTVSHQFRDMLDALTTALGSGKNVNDSFISVYGDLKVQYDENAYIIKELAVILSAINNNIAIEDTIKDFGKRSGIDDIKSFASVFEVGYTRGGNLKDIIRNTHAILSEKMEIAEDIETMVTATKTEQNIMIVMPIALIAVIKYMSPDFAANFVTPTGIASTTVSIVLFIVAYYIGKKVLEIKI